jgi:hypothetical protein
MDMTWLSSSMAIVTSVAGENVAIFIAHGATVVENNSADLFFATFTASDNVATEVDLDEGAWIRTIAVAACSTMTNPAAWNDTADHLAVVATAQEGRRVGIHSPACRPECTRTTPVTPRNPQFW